MQKKQNNIGWNDFINTVDINEFKNYYLVENNTLNDTANHFNVSRNIVKRYIKEFNLHKPVSQRPRFSYKYDKLNNDYTYDEIIDYYITKNHSQSECVEYFNTTHAIFSRYLFLHDIHKPRELYYDIKKRTCFKLYGDETYRDKSYWTRYWEDESFRESQIRKATNTKKLNNSFIISSPENKFYEELCLKYGKDDVVHIYNEDPRYKFNCDFYIKSLDTFIELNIHPTHGNHPFNELDEEDIKLKKYYESKNTKWYNNVVKTWCYRDVKKFKCALDNNLNFIAIYNDGKMYNANLEEITWE